MNESAATHASPPGHGSAEGPLAHVMPPGVLLAVFAALIALTAITVAVTRVDLGSWNLVAALAIATVKASLVALYFMHLREESSLTWVFLTISFLFLGILFSFAFGDYLTRGWQNLPKGWE